MKFLILAIVFMVLLSSCTAGPNELEKKGQAGFWKGLWHGIIAPITWFFSLFFPSSVHVYDVHNTGGWYDFGFLLGAGAILKGGSSASSKRK